MRISDWSSDVCSSDLGRTPVPRGIFYRLHISGGPAMMDAVDPGPCRLHFVGSHEQGWITLQQIKDQALIGNAAARLCEGGIQTDVQADLTQFDAFAIQPRLRSAEHTSELQSLMRISYAVFCLKK